MPAPSPLAIATSSVQRLVKEEASYHKELSQQEARLAKLQANEGGEENAEFQLKQEVSYNYKLSEYLIMGLRVLFMRPP